MIREVQTRWIVAPSYQKAMEFSIKRARDLATTHRAGLNMLEKARKRACWGWKLYEIRFIIEADETQ